MLTLLSVVSNDNYLGKSVLITQPAHSLYYAHHDNIQGHTSRTSKTTTDVREKQEGGILVPMYFFRIDLRTKRPPADTTPDTHHATSMSSHGSS